MTNVQESSRTCLWDQAAHKECCKLKNYAQVYPCKPSPKVLLASLPHIPKELGIIATPKFAVKSQSQERRWKKKRFATADERGLTHQDFISGMRELLVFYSALIETCGEEKALQVYPSFGEKLGALVWEEFLPSSQHFLECSQPWEAVRQYFREFFRALREANGIDYELVSDTDDEFHVTLTHCGWYMLLDEGGHPELAPFSGRSDVLCISKIMRGMGGDFTRERLLCQGDAVCDFHFHRYNDTQ